MPQTTAPAKQVLQRVSAEMASLTQIAETLQLSLNELISDLPDRNIDKLQCFQSLDLLTQTAENMAIFFDTLAKLSAADQHFRLEEAVQDLTLGDLVLRLKSEDFHDETSNGAQVSDCEIF